MKATLESPMSVRSYVCLKQKQKSSINNYNPIISIVTTAQWELGQPILMFTNLEDKTEVKVNLGTFYGF